MHPLIRRYIDWRQRRIAVRKLHMLDDHILADLGTERRGIEAFVDSVGR